MDVKHLCLQVHESVEKSMLTLDETMHAWHAASLMLGMNISGYVFDLKVRLRASAGASPSDCDLKGGVLAWLSAEDG